MAFLNSLNISGSGLTAGRLRMDVISENIANATTTRTADGGPYRRKTVAYQSIEDASFRDVLRNTVNGAQSAGRGVAVSAIEEDDTEFSRVYDPDHPDADEEGYVLMPNVDLVEETVDMMAASRAYEANLSVFNAVKEMASKALELGR